MSLEELAMPDLDLIKQGEQVRDRRVQFASGNRAARLLLAGESEALTRKAVEPALLDAIRDCGVPDVS